MRLATVAVDSPTTVSDAKDGRLVVVSEDGAKAAYSPDWQTLRQALDEWREAAPALRLLAKNLEEGKTAARPVEKFRFMAPLPRTWAWIDGSAFIQHILLVRKARNAEPPEDLKTVPLMYQGISDTLLGPNDDIPLISEDHGMDFEAEVAVILDEVPMGTKAKDAAKHIKLITIMNDVSLRRLIPRELAAGFGFFHGKPATAFAPFAATPEECGAAWKDGRLHLDLVSTLNGTMFGNPNAGPEMHFSFFELIEHAAKTRRLSAGTILGSGTVSNADESRGSSCIVERRMIEQIKTGKQTTPFMKAGDTIEIDMVHDGRSLFGKISQKVVPA